MTATTSYPLAPGRRAGLTSPARRTRYDKKEIVQQEEQKAGLLYRRRGEALRARGVPRRHTLGQKPLAVRYRPTAWRHAKSRLSQAQDAEPRFRMHSLYRPLTEPSYA